MLVMLKSVMVIMPQVVCRAADPLIRWGSENNPEWKTVAINSNNGEMVAPNGSIGFRQRKGKWLNSATGPSRKRIVPFVGQP